MILTRLLGGVKKIDFERKKITSKKVNFSCFLSINDFSLFERGEKKTLFYSFFEKKGKLTSK